MQISNNPSLNNIFAGFPPVNTGVDNSTPITTNQTLPNGGGNYNPSATTPLFPSTPVAKTVSKTAAKTVSKAPASIPQTSTLYS